MTKQLPRHEVIIRAIKLSKEMNPYPDYAFRPITNEKITEIVETLIKLGVSPDGFCAHFMRMSWKNACDAMIGQIREEFDK